MSDSDDDLAEMRRLRESQKYKGGTTARDDSSHLHQERQGGEMSKEVKGTVPSDNETLTMAEMMGFSGFGKKAKSFDFTEMFEQAKRGAQERIQVSRDDSTKESEVKETEDKDDDSEEDDDDMIGPPLPPGFNLPSSSDETKKSNQKKDGDEDSDLDDDEDDNDIDLKSKIPASHEISLNHGAKSVS
ncbi:WD repeat-containing protein 70 [Holothuria leucospilota]|uniref:WD repeat-containing protein 70 n=1 Tax=Holothuria leucospilota TaxID=206669 RepID=A0A9Q1H981_HOLLE|nr:WD repeat-containing protein 70 [Holothuria leucospilota]